MVEDSTGNINVYALDKDFNLVAIALPYTNLQWCRAYYEAGFFSMEIPLSVYDTSWAYIGSSDRPELGMVQKREEAGEGDVHIQISGFFCEKMLDDKTCYPRYKGDVTHTETAVRNIFNTYKDDLPIVLGAANSPLLGNRTQSDFSDDFLGKKLFSILETRELSYRVRYDFLTNGLSLEVWQGLDRTQSQTAPKEQQNGYQVFSTEFGNIADKNIDLDDSDYKNYAILPCNGDDNNVEKNTYYVDLSAGGYKKEIVFNMRSKRPEEGQSMTAFQRSVEQEGLEKLLSYAKIEDINIEMVGNAGYMVDFDLGDKCDVILNDVGLQMETRIIEVTEVFKASGHTVTVGLGNKRISNIRRVINSL